MIASVDWANYAMAWQEPRVEEMSGEDNGSDRSDPGHALGHQELIHHKERGMSRSSSRNTRREARVEAK